MSLNLKRLLEAGYASVLLMDNKHKYKFTHIIREELQIYKLTAFTRCQGIQIRC